MIIAATAFLLLGLAPMEVKVMDQKGRVIEDGTVLTGETYFKATVFTNVANLTVNQVEFSAGTALLGSDTSTPYEFKLDTLQYPDGQQKLVFSAYSNKGESVKRTILVKIDNHMNKGLTYHLEHAENALIESKWDEALTSGRVALKLDPKSVPARVAIARAYMGLGVTDKAQQYAEDAAELGPNDEKVVLLFAGVSLQRAFTLYNQGDNQKETLNQIGTALKKATDIRRQSLEARMDRLQTAGGLPYAEAALDAGRYTVAINTLLTEFLKDPTKTKVGNSLAYAQLRIGRWQHAMRTAVDMQRAGSANAYTQAVLAIALTNLNDRDAAADALKKGQSMNASDLGVLTAQALLALDGQKTSELSEISTKLVASHSQLPEVNYYISALANRLYEPEESRRRYERALLAEPLFYDMYVERANETVDTALKSATEEVSKKAEIAKMLYEVALTAKPDAVEALCGLAIVALLQNQEAVALKMAQAAVDASPNYAGAYYVLAAAQSQASKPTALYQSTDTTSTGAQAQLLSAESRKTLEKAWKLDPANLGGRDIPTVQAAYKYLSLHGRMPVIVAP